MSATRRAAVAAALHAGGEAGVSGEALARELGISRMAVSKHVATLREMGFAIASSPRIGYRLLGAPDACLPETVAPLVTDPLFVAWAGGREVASTNDEAKRLARAGAPEGVVVLAAIQTGGRGRFGRTWDSPSGGVYLSCVLRPALAPAAMGPLPVALAIGAAEGLASLGVPVGLKWPNDLVVDGRKLGGVLVEMAAEADRVEWVVVGCGVNVAPVATPGVAWVREHAPGVSVAGVAAVVADGMAAAYARYRAGALDVVAEFARLDTLVGQQVAVRDLSGTVVAEGVAGGIVPDGRLIVHTAHGSVEIMAGEVTLRG